MTLRGSSEPSTPVHFVLGNGVFTEGNKWSGREDSNLRPLPPERNAPRRTQRHRAASKRGDLLSGGVGHPAFSAKGFTASLRPLSIWNTDKLTPLGWGMEGDGL